MEERELQGSLLEDCANLVVNHPESMHYTEESIFERGSLKIIHTGDEEYDEISIDNIGREVYHAESINPGFSGGEDGDIMVRTWINQVNDRTKDEIIRYLEEL